MCVYLRVLVCVCVCVVCVCECDLADFIARLYVRLAGTRLIEHNAQHLVAFLGCGKVQHALPFGRVQLRALFYEVQQLIAIQRAGGKEFHEDRLAKDLIPVIDFGTARDEVGCEGLVWARGAGKEWRVIEKVAVIYVGLGI